eukprot:9145037-Pyramimonas_sp.AAC.1
MCIRDSSKCLSLDTAFAPMCYSGAPALHVAKRIEAALDSARGRENSVSRPSKKPLRGRRGRNRALDGSVELLAG